MFYSILKYEIILFWLWFYKIIIKGLKDLNASRNILNGNDCACLRFREIGPYIYLYKLFREPLSSPPLYLKIRHIRLQNGKWSICWHPYYRSQNCLTLIGILTKNQSHVVIYGICLVQYWIFQEVSIITGLKSLNIVLKILPKTFLNWNSGNLKCKNQCKKVRYFSSLKYMRVFYLFILFYFLAQSGVLNETKLFYSGKTLFWCQ